MGRPAGNWAGGLVKLMALPRPRQWGPLFATQGAFRRLGWTGAGPCNGSPPTGRHSPLGAQSPSRGRPRLLPAGRVGDPGVASTVARAELTRTSPGLPAGGWRAGARSGKSGPSAVSWLGAPGRRPGSRRPGWWTTPPASSVGKRRRPCCGWGCPALAAARHQAQVADLAQLGAALNFQPLCFWLNGVMPEAEVAVATSEPMQRREGPERAPCPGLAVGEVMEA